MSKLYNVTPITIFVSFLILSDLSMFLWISSAIKLYDSVTNVFSISVGWYDAVFTGQSR